MVFYARLNLCGHLTYAMVHDLRSSYGVLNLCGHLIFAIVHDLCSLYGVLCKVKPVWTLDICYGAVICVVHMVFHADCKQGIS